jgi:hypothetical protein
MPTVEHTHLVGVAEQEEEQRAGAEPRPRS